MLEQNLLYQSLSNWDIPPTWLYEVLLNKLERELENFVDMPPLERMLCELTAFRSSLTTLQEMVLEMVLEIGIAIFISNFSGKL